MNKALSDEEWRAAEKIADEGWMSGQMEAFAESVNGNPSQALAALALDSMLYLTWEDVDFLRNSGWHTSGDIAEGLDELADRIEALLPPRP